jgi:hypothetical protein
MADIRRRASRIILAASETINATATFTSDVWNVTAGQKFAVYVDGLTGTTPDLNIDLIYYPGLNSGGMAVTESVVAGLSSAPSTPYDALSIDDRPCKSLKCLVTGQGGNGVNTVLSLSIVMY